jgi:hypothetical protein
VAQGFSMTRGLIFGGPRLATENYSIFSVAEGNHRKWLYFRRPKVSRRKYSKPSKNALFPVVLCGICDNSSQFTHIVWSHWLVWNHGSLISDFGQTCLIYRTYPVTHRVPDLWFDHHQTCSICTWEVRSNINTTFTYIANYVYISIQCTVFQVRFVTFIPTKLENVPQNGWPHCVVFLQNIRRIYTKSKCETQTIKNYNVINKILMATRRLNLL